MGPATVVDVRPIRLINGNHPASWKIQLEAEAALGRLAGVPNPEGRFRFGALALWDVTSEPDIERFKIGDVVWLSNRGMSKVALVNEETPR